MRYDFGVSPMRATNAKPRAPAAEPPALPKCPTGIRGLDEITLGGLPRGRPTLVCGGPGCGKTLLGMEFLVRGATLFSEPGVCIRQRRRKALEAQIAALQPDLETEDLVSRQHGARQDSEPPGNARAAAGNNRRAKPTGARK